MGQGTGVSSRDICNSTAEGTLEAPVLFLNTSRAQEGEIVLAQCVLQNLVPAIRIVLCKDRVEEYVMKAQEGKIIYSMPLNISARSTGSYACGYQHRNASSVLLNSVLSAPQYLRVTGHVSYSTTVTAPTEPHTQQDYTVIAVASVAATLLLSAATCWIIKKGACRERCGRQQNVPSQRMEATDYGEIQYSTIAHFRRDKKNSKL
ncbi:uncharacterized protein LOC110390998 isoform X2 [Numida meleagris]|uniref:uncharacterized protein LOC110390998 isoform X2 n=1 Tax=Numida meleagris TaxID=8996 RepID=UPI000B3D8374|nr:uncharacterized protein LOC110390998 isoform X2 [Numida meleagris]